MNLDNSRIDNRSVDSSLIDNRYAVETPEGVELMLTPAGVNVRVLAYLIDFGIRALVVIAVSIAMVFAGTFGEGIILTIMFLIEWFYPVYFEVRRGGATPGKKQMGLLVLHDDGTPLRFSSSMLRNLLRVVDFMPLGYFAGLLTMSLNEHFKRLGDLAAGSVVVYREELRLSKSKGEADEHFVLPRAIQSLSFEQQQAIIKFGERSDSLSLARQDELAAILNPLIGGEGQETREILKRSANSLLGK